MAAKAASKKAAAPATPSGGSGSILNYTESSNWPQNVLFTDRSNRLDRLTITVLDRFGNILNNNGLDWAFTLEIESAN